MFVLGNLLGAVAMVLSWAINILIWIIIINALLSWVRPDPYNPIVRTLAAVSDVILNPIRRLIPMRVGIDFSPLIAILLLYFTQAFVVATLRDLAQRL